MSDLGQSSRDQNTGLITGFASVLLTVSALSAYGSLQTFATQSARIDVGRATDDPLIVAAAVSLVMSMLCAYGAVGFMATIGGKFRRSLVPALFAVTLVFMLLGIAGYGMWSSPPACPGGCA